MAACGACGFANADGATACAGCGRAFGGARPFNEIVMRNPPTPRPSAPPMPPPRWRPILSRDPTEHAFLVTLRAKPDDAARMVYADWLEQQGDRQRAVFVRHEGSLTKRTQVLGTDDFYWRTIVGRTDIECRRTNCAGRWDALDADPTDEQRRHCQTCTLGVRYCATRADVEAAAWTAVPYVIDADLDRDEVRSWHDQATLVRALSL